MWTDGGYGAESRIVSKIILIERGRTMHIEYGGDQPHDRDLLLH